MNKQEDDEPRLDEYVIKALELYLHRLSCTKPPSKIAAAIEKIRKEYEATGNLRPTQIALLQRCFYRTRSSRYVADTWFPINHLDIAIAEELNGQPHRMLSEYEIASAIGWLAMPGNLTASEVEWHNQIEEQLLLTGWLSKEQLAELKHRYVEAHRRWKPTQW